VTIFFPDLSHWDRDRGVRMEAGTAAVIAKVTQARTVADPAFAWWRSEAARVGAVFAAYHWLNHGNVAAQAKWCHEHAGSTPLMIDAEDVQGNTGYNAALSVADMLGFTDAYRALGGVVALVYLPRWYWQANMGSPDLRPLAAAGLGLVASNYRAYSEQGAGWLGYGGMPVTQWQYTNKQPYGGASCDFNAFKGNIEAFTALISGGDMAGITYAQYDRDRVNAIFGTVQALADAVGVEQASLDAVAAKLTGGLPVTMSPDAITALAAAIAANPNTPGGDADVDTIKQAISEWVAEHLGAVRAARSARAPMHADDAPLASTEQGTSTGGGDAAPLS
jgi:GH25 family lysozyme M1 (1,4-beta-N-acetylmuramidase)